MGLARAQARSNNFSVAKARRQLRNEEGEPSKSRTWNKAPKMIGERPPWPAFHKERFPKTKTFTRWCVEAGRSASQALGWCPRRA